MRLVREGERLFAPGVCHICEGAPLPGVKVVDTEHDFEHDGYEGRKYVCEGCAKELGALVKK